MRSSKRSPGAGRKVLVMRGRRIRRHSRLSSANERGTAATTAQSVRPSIERKLRELQRMLPVGYPEINMETLFQTTAEYIFLLEAKVSLLQNLSTLYGV